MRALWSALRPDVLHDEHLRGVRARISGRPKLSTRLSWASVSSTQASSHLLEWNPLSRTV
jgi:hypothetical protein